MAEVMSNSENLMGRMDLQSARKQGDLIPTLLVEDSRTQLTHLAQHSVLDQLGQVSCGWDRGSQPAAPQLLLQPGACGCPNAFAPCLCKKPVVWDTEISINACRLCAKALGHWCVATADW